jgi:hypothetical protein
MNTVTDIAKDKTDKIIELINPMISEYVLVALKVKKIKGKSPRIMTDGEISALRELFTIQAKIELTIISVMDKEIENE